ncbi:transporter substrate-binding domain-containing protein [Bosea sp. UNC402CLCol]|uniref:transporter substrate-binding domain-containing protein n=1 Tax=Bosea sp. UNC402CLCol TaxID=1510531 RepID=UPI00056F4B7A|nr:transporter substrate-binding domain-containing protein [Bosea sp. UNC402CLCol]
MLTESGRLRAAINLGNPVLAQRRPNGELIGVTVALARALADREGLALDLIPFDGAGKVVDAAADDIWDVAFLAIDPKRATEIAFTEPYLTIEGVFVVAAASPFQSIRDVDQAGVRVSVGRGAAYDLHLTRTLKHAEIVRVPTSAEVLPHFLSRGLEAGAGIRQPAAAFVARNPGLRLIEEPFMEIRQAMALPIRQSDQLPRLQRFLDDAAVSGLIAESLSNSAENG